MMSLPDFREKHVLFIMPWEANMSELRYKNENFCVVRDGKIANQISCHKLLAVFIVGDATITTNLIRESKEHGVSLFLLRNNFTCYSSLVAEASGNFLLRSKQYYAGTQRHLDIAKHLVSNKIFNQQLLLIERKQTPMYTPEQLQKKIQNTEDAKVLLGLEGSSTKDFFAGYFVEVGWYRRMPRAKPDVLNLLMDIGYTMLFNLGEAMLGLYGFDTYKGVYHTLFFQRKSLACDIIEPFRCVIDRQILKSFHLKQIDPKDFVCRDGTVHFASFQIQKKYLSIFSNALMDRKEDIFSYVRAFYYCVLNDTSEFPIFRITK